MRDEVRALLDIVAAQAAPDGVTAQLARWLALDQVPTASPAHRRRLVAAARSIVGVRGTSTALLAMLEHATGEQGIVLEESSDRPFHVVVHVPAGAAASIELIRRIVDLEKPVAVTSEVVLDNEA